MIQRYREHSTAQHSTAQSSLHKAANQVRADQSTYQKKNVRVNNMHAASGLFSWSTELLAFASRLFAPKMLGHLLRLSSQSILPCEPA